MFLFDTDHLGILQHRTSPESQNILRRMQAHTDEDFHVSVISFQEQVLGWNVYLSRAKDSAAIVRAYERFQQILTDFSAAQVLPFDQQAVDLFDQLRASQLRIGTMDLRIACIALTNDLTLLTRNSKDFAKVPNLKMEDWTL
jgi:tRNA(fMet)-specific endonuclease VapC